MKRILLLFALIVCVCAQSWAAFTVTDKDDAVFYEGIWNQYHNQYLGAQIKIGISRIGGWIHEPIKLDKYTIKRIEKNNVTGDSKATVLDLPTMTEVDPTYSGTFKMLDGSELIKGLEYDIVVFRDLFEVEDVADYEATTTLSYEVSGKQGLTNKSITIVVNFNDKPTAVEEVAAEKAVSNVTYYNVSGVASAEPFDGVNIVVTKYADGTKKVEKILK